MDSIVTESHYSPANLDTNQSLSEQSDDVQSSENLVPNDTNSTISTSGEPISNNVESNSFIRISNNTDMDQSLSSMVECVSSTIETQTTVTVKQSISSSTKNHQTTLIPSMEPYLEEGSLDEKEFSKPTSSTLEISMQSSVETNVDSTQESTVSCLAQLPNSSSVESDPVVHQFNENKANYITAATSGSDSSLDNPPDNGENVEYTDSVKEDMKSMLHDVQTQEVFNLMEEKSTEDLISMGSSAEQYLSKEGEMQEISTTNYCSEDSDLISTEPAVAESNDSNNPDHLPTNTEVCMENDENGMDTAPDSASGIEVDENQTLSTCLPNSQIPDSRTTSLFDSPYPSEKVVMLQADPVPDEPFCTKIPNLEFNNVTSPSAVPDGNQVYIESVQSETNVCEQQDEQNGEKCKESTINEVTHEKELVTGDDQSNKQVYVNRIDNPKQEMEDVIPNSSITMQSENVLAENDSNGMESNISSYLDNAPEDKGNLNITYINSNSVDHNDFPLKPMLDDGDGLITRSEAAMEQEFDSLQQTSDSTALETSGTECHILGETSNQETVSLHFKETHLEVKYQNQNPEVSTHCQINKEGVYNDGSSDFEQMEVQYMDENRDSNSRIDPNMFDEEESHREPADVFGQNVGHKTDFCQNQISLESNVVLPLGTALQDTNNGESSRCETASGNMMYSEEQVCLNETLNSVEQEVNVQGHFLHSEQQTNAGQMEGNYQEQISDVSEPTIPVPEEVLLGKEALGTEATYLGHVPNITAPPENLGQTSVSHLPESVMITDCMEGQSRAMQPYICQKEYRSEAETITTGPCASLEQGRQPNTAVCEADSSENATESAYIEQSSLLGSQNVYVVSDNLGLNPVPTSASMTPYHNNENTMLVEMAPLAADGTYVTGHTQVRYVDTSLSCDGGQEGMISDAQAAELLMRVSEQRPLSLQDHSSVPYVQVQLAQTVEGITHLVEVPASALSYLPSTLVYSTPVNSGSVSSADLATWVVEAPPSADQHHPQQGQQQGTENKFSDIVSASIEAIGFPESAAPGTTILSQAEQILIAADNSNQQIDSSSTAANFDFEENNDSQLALIGERGHSAGSIPRPKRESIESRINRLLRGTNAQGPENVAEESPAGKPAIKTVKLAPISSPKPVVSSSATSVTLSLSSAPKRPGRPTGRPVSIPTVYTSVVKTPTSSASQVFPTGNDYFMPRGVTKRKAQNYKVQKVNPSNPNCIDAEPAPPEETQVKLVMGTEIAEEEEPNKDDDDDYNRLVLLQARQRQQSEQIAISSAFNAGPDNRLKNRLSPRYGQSNRQIIESNKQQELDTAENVSSSSESPAAKRVRLSFPPDQYADLDSVGSYMAELRTPKLTYSSPRSRQIRQKGTKEATTIDNSHIKSDKEISVQLPWMNKPEMDEEDDSKRKKLPRIIRQSSGELTKLRSDTNRDDSAHIDDPDGVTQEQVIVIGLQPAGQQPSEEQLTAIIQAAIEKQVNASSESTVPIRTAARLSSNAKSNAVANTSNPIKRKVDEDGTADNEENGFRLKVIRTYDRNNVFTRRKPRSKKTSVFLDIFEFNEEEEEDDEDEDVDDLERFSQALADEEKRIREREKQVDNKSEHCCGTSSPAAPFRGGSRGRGRSGVGIFHPLDSSYPTSSAVNKTKSSRGGRSRGNKRFSRAHVSPKSRGSPNPKQNSIKTNDEEVKSEPASAEVPEAFSDEDCLAYTDDIKDDDYIPSRGRGRGRNRGSVRGRRGGRRNVGRRRSTSKEESLLEDEEEDDVDELREEEEGGEDDEAGDEDEMRIPGMPSKSCPDCKERFTTQEGFLEHVISHSSAKCLLCEWTNGSSRGSKLLIDHMLDSHRNAIPATRIVTQH